MIRLPYFLMPSVIVHHNKTYALRNSIVESYHHGRLFAALRTSTAPLWTLIGLNLRGRLRRMVRGVGTPRGMTFLLIGILMFIAWLGPMIYRATHAPLSNPQFVQTAAPFAILFFCIGNIFDSPPTATSLLVQLRRFSQKPTPAPRNVADSCCEHEAEVAAR